MSALVRSTAVLLVATTLGGCAMTGRSNDKAIAAETRAKIDALQPGDAEAKTARERLYLRGLERLQAAAQTKLASADTASDPAAMRRGIEGFIRLLDDLRTATADGPSGLAARRTETKNAYVASLLDDDDATDQLLETGLQELENELWTESDNYENQREEYAGTLWRRQLLFERKYFGEEGETSNYLEAGLNGLLSFTSFNAGDDHANSWPRTDGVSSIEAIARIEPIVTIDDGNQAGLMGAVGLTQHLFPEFKKSPEAEFGWRKEETDLSDWVKRIGVRVGGGILEDGGNRPDLVLGSALQIRSLSVWAIYNFEEDEFSIAVGASDLGLFTDWLPGGS